MKETTTMKTQERGENAAVSGMMLTPEQLVNDRRYYGYLWRKMVRMCNRCREEHRRFCVRRAVRMFFGDTAMVERQIREACGISMLAGYEELSSQVCDVRKWRELVRALACMDLGVRRVNLQLLDAAYSDVFPERTRLNVNKKAVRKDK